MIGKYHGISAIWLSSYMSQQTRHAFSTIQLGNARQTSWHLKPIQPTTQCGSCPSNIRIAQNQPTNHNMNVQQTKLVNAQRASWRCKTANQITSGMLTQTRVRTAKHAWSCSQLQLSHSSSSRKPYMDETNRQDAYSKKCLVHKVLADPKTSTQASFFGISQHTGCRWLLLDLPAS